MKVAFLLTVLFAFFASDCTMEEAAAGADDTPIEEERKNGVNGWYIPQINNAFNWMSLDEVEPYIAERKLHAKGLNCEDISTEFYIYTRKNPNRGQRIAKKSIYKSNFNPKYPTRFVIHGWRGNYEDEMNTIIRAAWLGRGEYNIISVDWEVGRNWWYPRASAKTPCVGRNIASMINFLVKNYQMSLETLNVIGFSLGGHVAGYAGKNVMAGQIHTIVGLDPSQPLFGYDEPKQRLANTDAYYVETIHTSRWGMKEPIGKVSFYPNGRHRQPGCGLDLNMGCSHRRAYEFYTEAIAKNSFIAIKCEDHRQAQRKECGKNFSKVRMGAINTFLSFIGIFYVPVRDRPLYGLGQ